MANKILKEVMKKLILAEKRFSHIQSIHHETIKISPAEEIKHLSEIIARPELPSPPPLPNLPAALPSMPIQKLFQTPPMQINLGKLNHLLQNPQIKIIECLGAGKNIRIKNQIAHEINLQLTESEIFSIINVFAKAANVQIAPIFKADFGNLTINAFISPALGAKFLILRH